MSAGFTADVVYDDVKALLLSAAIPPGSRLAPHRLARRIGAGLTPIREALLRLTGERLVEMKVNDGFHLPVTTEGTLRDLYAWNEDLVRLALNRAATSGAGKVPALDTPRSPGDIGASFLALAAASRSDELTAQMASCNDRIFGLRLAEAKVLGDWQSEAIELSIALVRADEACLELIHEYHARRIRFSVEILSALHRMAEP